MKEAELYDGTVLEFPDNTPNAVIVQTVKRVTSERKAQSYKTADPSEYDPSSPEWQAKYGSVSGNNPLQNFNIGAGKFFTDAVLGLRQLTGQAPASAAADKRALDAAIMDTTAGKLGYGGAAIATGLPIAMATGATVPGAALAGGILGAVQPAASVGERYLNTARDAGAAALGQQGMNAVLGRVGSYATPFGRVSVPNNFVPPTVAVRESYAPPEAESLAAAQAAGQAGAGASVSVRPEVSLRQQGGYTFGAVGDDPGAGLSRTQQGLAAWGKEQGLRLTPGQATGSRALQQLEAKLESQPMTSGPFNQIKTENARKINAIVAKSIGEKSDEVSSEVLDAANTRLGRIFDMARNPNTVLQADPAATKSLLDQMEGDLSGLIPEGAFRGHALVKIFERQMESGSINGEQLGQLSSKLGRASYKEMSSPSGDRDLGMALASLKEHVDDLLESSMPKDFRAEYAAARSQYRNLINILHGRGTVNTATGDVRGRSLASTLKSKDRRGYTFGRNKSDLYNAARFSEAFAPVVGDSGTATRSPLPNSSLEFALGIPVNVLARAYTSNTATAAAVAAARAGANASQFMAPVSRAAGAAAELGGLAFPYTVPGSVNALYGLYGNK